MSLSLYAIGGLGIVAVLAVGYATLEHSWRQNAEIVAAQEKEANIRNQETIAILKDANALSAQVAMELSEQLGTLAAKKEEDDEAITEVLNSDEEARKWASTPIPARIRCVLNHEKCPDRNANTDAK